MTAAISTLIVDDEALARQRVARLLACDPQFQVIEAVDSVAKALEAIEDQSPELVLLDIRMPLADGFALLEHLQGREVVPFVIFITAYSDHAVRAFDVQAVDYVLKPFEDERFAQALGRAKAAIRAARVQAAGGNGQSPPVIEPPGAVRAFQERLLIAKDGRVVFLPARDIEFVQSAGKYVKVFAQGKCELVRQPMHEIESRLDPRLFVRVHRSSIVNIEQVVEMHPLFHGDYELVLKRGTRLTMSRRFRSRFDRFLVNT